MLTSHAQHTHLEIDEFFQGLPDVAHGGYVAGLVATELGTPSAEVRLRRPVPTGRGLELARAGDDLVELREGEELLARGAPAELSLELPAPVSFAEAEAASERFPGRERHLFPRCVVCGQEHEHGLRIFPGPVSGRRLIAAAWVPPVHLAGPDGELPAAFAWAALDCPQLWSLIAHAPADSPDVVVTASLAARVERPIVAGEPHVVTAWPIRRDGRRWLAGAAVTGPDGELRVIGVQTAAIAGWGVPLGQARWTPEAA